MEATYISIERWTDKEGVVCTHNGILAIKGNIFEWILMSWMNLAHIIKSEVSQKEKNKYRTLTHIHMWNLEGWYWWNYLQGSNGDADIGNRLVDIVEEGEVGMNWESDMEINTLPYVK